MKTYNTANVQAMKNEMKRINAMMKELLEAEAQNMTAANTSEYESSKVQAKVSCGEIMNSLQEMVKIASQMSEYHGECKWYETHEIIKKDIRTK